MGLILDKYEQALAYEIFLWLEYAEIDEQIRNAKTILDIGWHIGLFALYCLWLKTFNSPTFKKDDIYNIKNFVRKIMPHWEITIHLFEPVSSNIEKAFNLLDWLWKYVNINKLWISDSLSEDKLFLSAKSMQSSRRTSFLNNGSSSEICRFIRLDSFFKDKGIVTVDVMKIDVEGDEFIIIESLSDNILSNIKCLIIEYHLIDNESADKLRSMISRLEHIYKVVYKKEAVYDKRVGIIVCKNK